MTTTLERYAVLGAIIVAMCATIFALLVISSPKADASSYAGGRAVIATSTLGFVVQTSQTLLAATSTCTSRIITTTAQPVMLTFSDIQGLLPTAVKGHLQAASTTVVYDSGLYGCGAYRVISATGVAGTLSISETQ